MINSVIRNIINVDKGAISEQKTKLSHHAKKKTLTILPIIILAALMFKMLTSLNQEIALINDQKEKKISNIKGCILKNNYIDKAINDVNEINLSTKDTKKTLSIEDFKNTIAYLSYYYKISGPLIIKNVPAHTSSSLNPVRLHLFLSAPKDAQIIQFVDSLLTNLDGFVLIQKIDISQNTGSISTDVIFDWYTTKSIENSIRDNPRIVVEPRIFDGQIEDKYRISVWNGTIVSNK